MLFWLIGLKGYLIFTQHRFERLFFTSLTADARLPVQLTVALVHDAVGSAHLPPPPPPAVMVMTALMRRVATGGARGRADALGGAGGQDTALAAGTAFYVAA